jgi:hypothetical protein
MGPYRPEAWHCWPSLAAKAAWPSHDAGARHARPRRSHRAHERRDGTLADGAVMTGWPFGLHPGHDGDMWKTPGNVSLDGAHRDGASMWERLGRWRWTAARVLWFPAVWVMVPCSSEGWRGLRLCRQFEEKGLGVVLTKEGSASIQKPVSLIVDYHSRWWIHGQGALGCCRSLRAEGMEHEEKRATVVTRNL